MMTLFVHGQRGESMSDFEKLINASDLIEWIMDTYPDWCCVGAVRSIVGHVDNMPSAQPERKIGEWIKVDPHIVVCPFCKKASSPKNFCADCGARLGGWKCQE